MTKNTLPIDARALAQSGLTALQLGDAPKPRLTFEQMIEKKIADVSVLLGLAYACKAMKDHEAAIKAIDQALVLEPRNLRALIYKADHFFSIENTKAASAFYQAALDSVSKTNQPSADVRQDLAYAKSMLNSCAQKFESFLHQQLDGKLLALDKQSQRKTERFKHSIDLLLGKKQIFFQNPRLYFFPVFLRFNSTTVTIFRGSKK